MRYVYSCIEKNAVERAYRIYVTDSLKFISENTAHSAGGSAFKVRFAEVTAKKKPETRTGEEIIGDLRSKLHSLGDNT